MPSGVATLRESLARVLQEKRPQALPIQRYPIRRPAPRAAEFEERYWSALNTPVLADDGRVAYILHRAEDVTEVVRLRREKLEQKRTLREESVRSPNFRKLLDTAPDAIVVVGEDGASSSSTSRPRPCSATRARGSSSSRSTS